MFVIILPAPYTIGNFLNTIIFHVLIVLALSSHAAAMLTDPGTVPLNNATPENIEKETIQIRQKEQMQCECGCMIARSDIAKHKKTKKHIDLMNAISQ